MVRMILTGIVALMLSLGGCAHSGRSSTGTLIEGDANWHEDVLAYKQYALNHLSVKTEKDVGRTYSRLKVIYINDGELGMQLKTSCWWSTTGDDQLNEPEKYNVLMPPNSKYQIRVVAYREAQNGLKWVCDHGETINSLPKRIILKTDDIY